MGDRGNIVLNYGDNRKVYLYTHWGRWKIGTELQNALRRSRSRWNDPSYLARIIFAELIKHDIDSLTGFGIDVYLGDGDETAEVNFENNTIRFKDNEPVTFSEFILIEDVDSLGLDSLV